MKHQLERLAQVMWAAPGWPPSDLVDFIVAHPDLEHDALAGGYVLVGVEDTPVDEVVGPAMIHAVHMATAASNQALCVHCELRFGSALIAHWTVNSRSGGQWSADQVGFYVGPDQTVRLTASCARPILVQAAIIHRQPDRIVGRPTRVNPFQGPAYVRQ